MIWKCRNKEINYTEKPIIMGIINVTPDSFSDGGDYYNAESAVAHALEHIENGADILDFGAQSTRPGHVAINALEHIENGADILDFGAQSTRPGHVAINADEEIRRLTPVLEKIRLLCTLPISVDTYYPEVAAAVIELGADIINDVSGVINPEMARIIKQSGAGWIIMHNGDGGVDEVSSFFDNSINECEALGINASQLCLDMGIGFGKTRPQDLELIAGIKHYKRQGYPLLLGTSRKRVIGEYSAQAEPKKRIYGNIAADTAAVFGGADIFRVHDVKSEKQGIYMAYALKKAYEKIENGAK